MPTVLTRRSIRLLAPPVVAAAIATACATGVPVSTPPVSAPVAVGVTTLPAPVPCAGACWKPAVRTSWNWVLAHVPTAPYRDVTMYDIDGFDATAATVTALHGAGTKVVCYLSAGTWEDWRPDAARFPAAIRGGAVDGWPGERWLDVRDIGRAGSPLAAAMRARLDLCDRKGFDGVELDNVDGYANGSGFPITARQQQVYNAWLSTEAHARGLVALLKNDVGQLAALEPYFDGALNEQCNQHAECGGYAVFVARGKPVFNAEYGTSTGFCAGDDAAGYNGLSLSVDLDDSRFRPCR